MVDPGELPVDGTETCGGFLCSGDVVNISYDDGTDTLTLVDAGSFSGGFNTTTPGGAGGVIGGGLLGLEKGAVDMAAQLDVETGPSLPGLQLG